MLACQRYLSHVEHEDEIAEQFKEFRPPEVEVKTLEPFDVKVTAENVETIERLAEMAASVYCCPVCDFLAASPAARCPRHGRKVVPG